MTGKTCDTSVLVALALTALNAGARVLIAQWLGGSVGGTLVAFPTVLALVLSDARRARADGLGIAVPLAMIGGIVAARMAVGYESGQALLLSGAVCAAVFVLTLAFIPDTARLERTSEMFGFVGLMLVAPPLVPSFGVSHGGPAAWVTLGGLQITPDGFGRPLVLTGFASALSRMPMTFRETCNCTEIAPVARRAAIVPVIVVAAHAAERDLGAGLLLAQVLAGLFATVTGKLRRFAVP